MRQALLSFALAGVAVVDACGSCSARARVRGAADLPSILPRQETTGFERFGDMLLDTAAENNTWLEKRSTVRSECNEKAVDVALKACAEQAKKAKETIEKYESNEKAKELLKIFFKEEADKKKSRKKLINGFDNIFKECSADRAGNIAMACTDEALPQCKCTGRVTACTTKKGKVVRLCKIFFDDLPPAGCGSLDPGGVIVHELSHAIAETDDMGYGMSAVDGLSGPKNMRHADSWAMFAQAAKLGCDRSKLDKAPKGTGPQAPTGQGGISGIDDGGAGGRDGGDWQGGTPISKEPTTGNDIDGEVDDSDGKVDDSDGEVDDSDGAGGGGGAGGSDTRMGGGSSAGGADTRMGGGSSAGGVDTRMGGGGPSSDEGGSSSSGNQGSGQSGGQAPKSDDNGTPMSPNEEPIEPDAEDVPDTRPPPLNNPPQSSTSTTSTSTPAPTTPPASAEPDGESVGKDKQDDTDKQDNTDKPSDKASGELNDDQISKKKGDERNPGDQQEFGTNKKSKLKDTSNSREKSTQNGPTAGTGLPPSPGSDATSLDKTSSPKPGDRGTKTPGKPSSDIDGRLGSPAEETEDKQDVPGGVGKITGGKSRKGGALKPNGRQRPKELHGSAGSSEKTGKFPRPDSERNGDERVPGSKPLKPVNDNPRPDSKDPKLPSGKVDGGLRPEPEKNGNNRKPDSKSPEAPSSPPGRTSGPHPGPKEKPSSGDAHPKRPTSEKQIGHKEPMPPSSRMGRPDPSRDGGPGNIKGPSIPPGAATSMMEGPNLAPVSGPKKLPEAGERFGGGPVPKPGPGSRGSSRGPATSDGRDGERPPQGPPARPPAPPHREPSRPPPGKSGISPPQGPAPPSPPAPKPDSIKFGGSPMNKPSSGAIAPQEPKLPAPPAAAKPGDGSLGKPSGSMMSGPSSPPAPQRQPGPLFKPSLGSTEPAGSGSGQSRSGGGLFSPSSLLGGSPSGPPSGSTGGGGSGPTMPSLGMTSSGGSPKLGGGSSPMGMSPSMSGPPAGPILGGTGGGI